MSLENRYDFVLLYDVKDGNPNGDPDAGNLPRVDSETGQGLVSDVCLKRKIRNFVALTRGEDVGYRIYVREKAILNNVHEEAYKAIGDESILVDDGDKSKDKKRKSGDVDKARQWMCANFFDVRTFGAVMSTGVNCGQVRGPVQLTFSRSVEPIVIQEHSITRCAVTTEKEAAEQQGDNRTMGRKNTVPYGLYVCHGFVSAFLANQTGFGEDDLNLLWSALSNMFDQDHSASRGLMSCKGLYVFKHESKLGNYPADKLFELVQIKRVSEGPARDFTDYHVTVDEGKLPQGVELLKVIA